MSTQIRVAAPWKGVMGMIALATSLVSFVLFAGFSIWVMAVPLQVRAAHNDLIDPWLGGFLVLFLTGLVSGVISHRTNTGRKALWVSFAAVVYFAIHCVYILLVYHYH